MDNIFARIYSGAFMTGVAFASGLTTTNHDLIVSNLPLDAVDCIVDTNPIARTAVARREDLTVAIRFVSVLCLHS